MRKLNLFVDYDTLLLSFVFQKGNYKDYNLSIYKEYSICSECCYYLIVNSSRSILFDYQYFYSISSLFDYVLNKYNIDISFVLNF